MKKTHALVLRSRGDGHIHRWAPECACGWVGRFKRRQRDAEREYHEHVDAHDTGRRRSLGDPPAPRRGTAIGELNRRLAEAS